MNPLSCAGLSLLALSAVLSAILIWEVIRHEPL